MKSKISDILSAVLGSTVFAVAVAWIASPSGLVTGGASGVGILVKELIGIPIFVTGLVLNIPLFIICTLQRGVRFITKSAIAFLSLTVALSILEGIPSPINLEGDLTLTSGAYAILSGLGLGIILRSGATSGGADMLAAIIRYRRPSFSMATLIAIIDIAVVLSGIAVFGARVSLYATASLFLSAKICDLILSGFAKSKTAFIISDADKEISDRINRDLGRGATGINAVGTYTGKERRILFTAMPSREIPRLRRIVAECDSTAFVIISDANKILGEGFDSLFESKDSFS